MHTHNDNTINISVRSSTHNNCSIYALLVVFYSADCVDSQRDQRIGDSTTPSSNPPADSTPILPRPPPQPAANQNNANPSPAQPRRPSSAPSNTELRPRPPPQAPPAPATAAPPAYTVNATARHARPRHYQRTAYRPPNSTTALIVKVQKPWDKCQHYFVIIC